MADIEASLKDLAALFGRTSNSINSNEGAGGRDLLLISLGLCVVEHSLRPLS